MTSKIDPFAETFAYQNLVHQIAVRDVESRARPDARFLELCLCSICRLDEHYRFG